MELEGNNNMSDNIKETYVAPEISIVKFSEEIVITSGCSLDTPCSPDDPCYTDYGCYSM